MTSAARKMMPKVCNGLSDKRVGRSAGPSRSVTQYTPQNPAAAIITMPQDSNNLIWIDMEMSGLNPDTDKVLEVAIVVTDSQLNTVAEAPVLVVHQPDTVLDAMDDWNRSTHAKSGLVERVKASALTEAFVQQQLVAFLSQHVPPKISPMCGNTVHQDR